MANKLTKLIEAVQAHDYHEGKSVFEGVMREKLEAALGQVRQTVKLNEQDAKKTLTEGEAFQVECMECGKKFKTKSMDPSCPKCGGGDIDLPTVKKESYGDEGENDFRDPGGKSALRTGKRSFPCPTCKRPNMLTAKDKSLGYQCDSCADRDEGGGY